LQLLGRVACPTASRVLRRNVAVQGDGDSQQPQEAAHGGRVFLKRQQGRDSCALQNVIFGVDFVLALVVGCSVDVR
jgi:hypothetical protein